MAQYTMMGLVFPDGDEFNVKDTTYGAATQSDDGLMSSSDKRMLNTLDATVQQLSANIGSVYSSNSGSVSVAFTGATKEVCSLTLPAGVYIVTGNCRFNGSTSGGRQGVTITFNNAASQFEASAYTLQTKPTTTTENQYYNVSRIVQVTDTNDTVYLMAFDVNATRTIAAYLTAVRVK